MEIRVERLTEDNFNYNSLDNFIRHQDVIECWRNVDGKVRSAWMEGKWERKENGRGKWGEGEYFPLLGWRENGRGKKMGEEKWVGPCPIFLPKFSLLNGEIMGEKSVAHY